MVSRTSLAFALVAFWSCSNSPTQTNNPNSSGSAGSNVAGSASAAGGTTTTTAGSPSGGAGGSAPSLAGSGGTSTGGALAGGAGGGAGSGGGGPTCKAITAVNGSGLTLLATDVSAFKYSTAPAPDVVKMAYDPVGHLVVMLTKSGKLFSMDPSMPLPATAVTTPLVPTTAYDSGYTANAGYVDHRGLAFGPDGSLYVLAVQISATSGVNIKKGTPGAAGGPRVWTTLVTTSQGFAAGETAYDHSFSGIAISADGMSLYFSSGSRTEHGEVEKNAREVPLTSAIFKVPTASPTDLKNDETALEPFLFADGTRNAYDLAFNAAGELIGTDNGPDIDLPDEVNFLEQGKHYGFPWRFGGSDNPVRDAAYVAAGDKRLHAGYGAVDNGSYAFDASFPPAPTGVTFTDPILNLGPDANFTRVDRNADPTQAGATGLAGVSGHRSPLGLAFDTAGVLCGSYYKQGFMLSYGAVLPSALGDQGNDLLLLVLNKTNGQYSMNAKQLAKGIKEPIDSVMIGSKLFSVGYGAGTPVYVFQFPTP